MSWLSPYQVWPPLKAFIPVLNGHTQRWAEKPAIAERRTIHHKNGVDMYSFGWTKKGETSSWTKWRITCCLPKTVNLLSNWIRASQQEVNGSLAVDTWFRFWFVGAFHRWNSCNTSCIALIIVHDQVDLWFQGSFTYCVILCYSANHFLLYFALPCYWIAHFSRAVTMFVFILFLHKKVMYYTSKKICITGQHCLGCTAM